MEFPFGNSHTHTHHHHHRRDEDRGDYYPPPGSTLSSFDNPPPSPQPAFYGVPPPPPPPQHHADSFNYGYPSAVPPSSEGTATYVHHDSYDVVRYETHHQDGSGLFSDKPTVRVVTKADPNYSLTIRNGNVVLALSDPRDEYQHWYKDLKYSTMVKDEEGCPAFSLVNKVTGEAIKHSIGASHPVRLIPYNPDYLDESILWTESKDLGDGHSAIRMVNNVHLNVDAYHGDKKSGGVHDGTTIVLWDWNSGDNQRWKILPY